MMANGAILLCEAPTADTDFKREIRLSFEEIDTHYLELLPLESGRASRINVNDNLSVGLGEIEIYEILGEQRELMADGQLIVIQANSSLMTGILLRFARMYTIRLDKNGNAWGFIFHDQTRQETISGECR